MRRRSPSGRSRSCCALPVGDGRGVSSRPHAQICFLRRTMALRRPLICGPVIAGFICAPTVVRCCVRSVRRRRPVGPIACRAEAATFPLAQYRSRGLRVLAVAACDMPWQAVVRDRLTVRGSAPPRCRAQRQASGVAVARAEQLGRHLVSHRAAVAASRYRKRRHGPIVADSPRCRPRPIECGLRGSGSRTFAGALSGSR